VNVYEVVIMGESTVIVGPKTVAAETHDIAVKQVWNETERVWRSKIRGSTRVFVRSFLGTGFEVKLLNGEWVFA
jgi:hypothetical protein